MMELIGGDVEKFVDEILQQCEVCLKCYQVKFKSKFTDYFIQV